MNPARRRLIADAAIDVLARSGAQGLSHRAVDVEAALPPGTTSNYFNSRHALMEAAGRRLAELHWQAVHALREQAGGRLDRIRLGAILEQIVTATDPGIRRRHLARYELFLAGVREPGLQPVLTDLRDAALQTAAVLLDGAGLPDPDRHVGLLAATLNGLTFDEITAPPGPLSGNGPGAASISHVLEAVFGPEQPGARRGDTAAATASR